MQKAAGEALLACNLSDCFYEKSTTLDDGNTVIDSEYDPHSDEDKGKGNLLCGSQTKGLEVERRFFCVRVNTVDGHDSSDKLNIQMFNS